MRAVYLVLFAVLLPVAACRAQNEDQSEAAISSKMTKLTGDAAIRCGLIGDKKGFDVAWACARQADAEQKPFWLALKLMRTDSDVWEGIARDASGVRYTFFYTSNKYGRPKFKPNFDVHKCTKPFAFDPNKLFVIGCLPI